MGPRSRAGLGLGSSDGVLDFLACHLLRGGRPVYSREGAAGRGGKPSLWGFFPAVLAGKFQNVPERRLLRFQHVGAGPDSARGAGEHSQPSGALAESESGLGHGPGAATWPT